jgi:hypothetical protein
MYSKTVKGSPMNRLLRGGVLMVGLLPGLALAAQPQGAWQGLVQQANTDVAAQARFRADAVDVHFDEPLACNVPAKLLKEDGAATVYRFGVSANGGKFCQELQGRNVTFTPAAGGRLAIDFPSSKTAWHGDLRPAATATP